VNSGHRRSRIMKRESVSLFARFSCRKKKMDGVYDFPVGDSTRHCKEPVRQIVDNAGFQGAVI
jgi:hypothetical protein